MVQLWRPDRGQRVGGCAACADRDTLKGILLCGPYRITMNDAVTGRPKKHVVFDTGREVVMLYDELTKMVRR